MPVYHIFSNNLFQEEVVATGWFTLLHVNIFYTAISPPIVTDNTTIPVRTNRTINSAMIRTSPEVAEITKGNEAKHPRKKTNLFIF